MIMKLRIVAVFFVKTEKSVKSYSETVLVYLQKHVVF